MASSHRCARPDRRPGACFSNTDASCPRLVQREPLRLAAGLARARDISNPRSSTMSNRHKRHAGRRTLPRDFDPNVERSTLGQAYLGALAVSFLRDGAKRLRELSEQRPLDYLKLAAALLPKEYRLKTVDFMSIDDAELAAVLSAVREAIKAKEKDQERLPLLLVQVPLKINERIARDSTLIPLIVLRHGNPCGL